MKEREKCTRTREAWKTRYAREECLLSLTHAFLFCHLFYLSPKLQTTCIIFGSEKPRPEVPQCSLRSCLLPLCFSISVTSLLSDVSSSTPALQVVGKFETHWWNSSFAQFKEISLPFITLTFSGSIFPVCPNLFDHCKLILRLEYSSLGISLYIKSVLRNCVYKECIKRLGSSFSFLDNLKTSKRRWEGQFALATQAY